MTLERRKEKTAETPLRKNITCWTTKEREPRRYARERTRDAREVGEKERTEPSCELDGDLSLKRDNRDERRRGKTESDEQDETDGTEIKIKREREREIREEGRACRRPEPTSTSTRLSQFDS